MSRLTRLYVEWQRLRSLDATSSLIDVEAFGDPPEKYIVTFHCKGLIWLEGSAAPSVSHKHQLEIYLHNKFPHFQPRLTWMTSIFHPNILPPQKNGGVCIGKWTPAETLDRLCIRIGEMVQYRNYSTTDPLDVEAAQWVSRNRDKFPLDTREFVNVAGPSLGAKIDINV